jgi:hypothetical protein
LYNSLPKDNIEQHLRNYDFLLGVLNSMIVNTEKALENDNRWFTFAPKVCRKFLNQAITLKSLFFNKMLEIGDKTPEPFEDVSAIYTTLRMQFETHALFYHLFIPCQNTEENILRFRLWELDGFRKKIEYRSILGVSAQNAAHDINYLTLIEKSIEDLQYFQELDEKKRTYLLRKSVWRFTELSLQQNDKNKWQISYEQLIKNTGIKESIYANLYSHFSMHTHPAYIGVVQSSGLNSHELQISKYVSVLYSCFLTSFLIIDFSKRFTQSKEQYELLSVNEKEIIQSFLNAGRN